MSRKLPISVVTFSMYVFARTKIIGCQLYYFRIEVRLKDKCFFFCKSLLDFLVLALLFLLLCALVLVHLFASLIFSLCSSFTLFPMFDSLGFLICTYFFSSLRLLFHSFNSLVFFMFPFLLCLPLSISSFLPFSPLTSSLFKSLHLFYFYLYLFFSLHFLLWLVFIYSFLSFFLYSFSPVLLINFFSSQLSLFIYFIFIFTFFPIFFLVFYLYLVLSFFFLFNSLRFTFTPSVLSIDFVHFVYFYRQTTPWKSFQSLE